MSARTLFVVGMGICVLSAALMIGEVVDVAWGSALGMVGVGVLSASALRRGDP